MNTTAEQELRDLERRGWEALSTDGATAMAFYREVLDHTVVMLMPGGLVLTDREGIISAMGGQPWASFEMDGLGVVRPTEDTATVSYGILARRTGHPEYSALISSHYVRRRDDWKLFFHQHTPR